MNKEMILKLERLCAMKFNDDEIKKLEVDMDESMKCINELIAINTDGVQDWFDEYELKTHSDVVENTLSPEELLKNTSKVYKNMIVVPNVI
jgi:aspartyl/glutamyl-tRNA(Asn/Gln) amidotransferase C subunit